MAIVPPLAELLAPPSRRSQIPSGIEFHEGRGWLTCERALVRRPNKNDANGYYKALGLLPDATAEQIKSAYRKLVKQLHPDLHPDREDLEELFKYVSQIVSVLLNPEEKARYDAVSGDAVYVGVIEREELARSGISLSTIEKHTLPEYVGSGGHWACWTTTGFSAGQDTDDWTELCREVAPATGYRGRLRIAVLEGGLTWPYSPTRAWGVLDTGVLTFLIFQRGVEPNRLHALCAMIEWQRHLQKQIQSKRA